MNVRDVIQALGALERAVGRERLEAAARVFGFMRVGPALSPVLERDASARDALLGAAHLLNMAPERPTMPALETPVEAALQKAVDEGETPDVEAPASAAPKRRSRK